jgi:hypothetical protein
MERFVRGPENGETMSDAVVIATLKSLGYKELIHYPSLLQHIGLESTLGNSIGRVSAFTGEDVDLLSLPAPKRPAPRNSTRCHFQREDDFMVCQVCGWRMRITDPSLPPEKYYAPCGGSDERLDNPHRTNRKSISKRSLPSKKLGKKRRAFQLGTFLASCLNAVGIRKKTGCGCGRREEALNRWASQLLDIFRRM